MSIELVNVELVLRQAAAGQPHAGGFIIAMFSLLPVRAYLNGDPRQTRFRGAGCQWHMGAASSLPDDRKRGIARLVR